MEKVLNPEEYEACQVTKKDKHVILQSLYNECEEAYRHVIEKVAAANTSWQFYPRQLSCQGQAYIVI